MMKEMTFWGDFSMKLILGTLGGNPEIDQRVNQPGSTVIAGSGPGSINGDAHRSGSNRNE